MSNTEGNIRILDRTTYPRKTLETFEMIAAYYIDLFYNHLYFEAKKLRNDKVVGSITEGYKHTLTSFLQGIEDPRLYKKSLLAMHTFFIENGFASLTFTQCMERVTREFIPEDYYESVINSKKNSILRSVLSGVNKNFILKLVNNYLSMVIDQHNEPDNTRILQDEFIDLLLIEKESMYKRFIVGKTKTSSNPNKSTIIESMQKEIKLLCSEKYNLKKLNVNLKKIILLKEKQHALDIAKIEQLTNIINELKNELPDNSLKVSAEDIEIVDDINIDEILDEVEPNEQKEVDPTPNLNNKKKSNENDKILEQALNSQLEDTSSLITFDEDINIWE